MSKEIRLKDRFKFFKWSNLVVFGIMYITMYLGRYNFNSILPILSNEFHFSETIENVLHSSVFLGYAIGCLVNGYTADSKKPKGLIVFGVIGSVCCNIVMYYVAAWPVMLIISMLNGFLQSMVWIGGISILVQWWKSSERGLAVGIANMCSSFAYMVVYLMPEFMNYDMGGDWRSSFGSSMFLLCYFALIFGATAKEKPEDIDEMVYEEEPDIAEREIYLANNVKPGYWNAIKFFCMKKEVRYWAAIALISSLCRYGLLAWLPIYYEAEHYRVFLDSATSNTVLSVGMALGTLVITYITGKYFSKNKGAVATVSAGLCGAIIIIFPSFTSSTTAVVGIFLMGFFLFGLNGLLWLYAMDIGGRVFAGTVTGILNAFAYIGATFEQYLFSFIIEYSGDWMFVFVSIEFLCIAMVIFGFLICKSDTYITEANA